MRSIHPPRSIVILGAAILALVLVAPWPANAQSGAVAWGVLLLEAADIGLGIYDLQAAVRNDRIGKRTAGLQLILTLPAVAFGLIAIGPYTEENGYLGTAICLAYIAIPLVVTVYSFYVLLSPDPKAQLSARLEREIGIQLPSSQGRGDRAGDAYPDGDLSGVARGIGPPSRFQYG